MPRRGQQGFMRTATSRPRVARAAFGCVLVLCLALVVACAPKQPITAGPQRPAPPGSATTTTLTNRPRATSPSGTPPSTRPSGTVPSLPAGTAPADAVQTLDAVSLGDADLAGANSMEPFTSGDDVRGATLDLCSADFPTELRKVARHQVWARDAGFEPLLSTEAVLYADASDTVQAFAELRAARDQCPLGPTDATSRRPQEIYEFNPQPDASWPAVPTVDRLAYDFDETAIGIGNHHAVAVYLRRGRLLLAIYFVQPDHVADAVLGQSTMQGITAMFAERVRALPESAVN